MPQPRFPDPSQFGMMAKSSKQPSNRPKENRRTRQKILHQIAQIEEPGVFAGQIACCKEQNKHQTDHRHHKAGNSRNLLAQNLHLIFSFRMHSVVSDTIFSLPYFCRFTPFPNGVKAECILHTAPPSADIISLLGEPYSTPKSYKKCPSRRVPVRGAFFIHF